MEYEHPGESDEWYTPAYIFEALGERFDLDVASPGLHLTHVPAEQAHTSNSLEKPWKGFVWMNPPFGPRNGIIPWRDKFIEHGHGLALAPARTSAPWWQAWARSAEWFILVAPKVKFIRPDGTIGKSPGIGMTIFPAGGRAKAALIRAEPLLGFLSRK